MSWVPGTVDRVPSGHGGQIYTVILRDVPRVSAVHHAQLTGRLVQAVTGTARLPAVPGAGTDAAPRAVRVGLPPTDWDGRD